MQLLYRSNCGDWTTQGYAAFLLWYYQLGGSSAGSKRTGQRKAFVKVSSHLIHSLPCITYKSSPEIRPVLAASYIWEKTHSVIIREMGLSLFYGS